ncbi:MAG TPA: hypothetical protein VF093_04075 [Solirubrobacterales bacterium]
MAVEDEIAELKQEVLSASVSSIEGPAAQALQPDGSAARARRARLQLLTLERLPDPPCRSQDRVALGHG